MNTIIEVAEERTGFIRIEAENLGVTAKIRDALKQSGKDKPFENITDVITRAKAIAGDGFTGTISYFADPEYKIGYVKAD